MKKKLIPPCFLIALLTLTTVARGQVTAFTYEGHLTENGTPANGANDFTFTLDFGAAFDGNARWLEIAVGPGASAGVYTNLTPRQAIAATPYALRALNAGSATTATSVAAGAVNNLALASDAVDAAKILNDSITSANLDANLLSGTFWNLGGNAGTIPGPQFMGAKDNQPLMLKGSFVGIGRSTRITGAEYIGVNAPVGSNAFGGMYLNTTNTNFSRLRPGPTASNSDG